MNKSTVAKDFLLKTPSKWQGAVNWLKKKVGRKWLIWEWRRGRRGDNIHINR